MQPVEALQRLLQEGVTAYEAGRPGQAKEAFERALTIRPDCVEAHVALSRLRFPGENYLQILARMHRHLQPRTYLEVGVASGNSMRQALPTTRCLGIDPAPVAEKIPEEAEIYIMTSDEFFARFDLKSILDGLPLDLGYIDGLHLFEAALADFVNLERFCTRGSTLMIDDCMPINALVASRERQTGFWTGDVWRVLPTLAHFRPDLSISVIGCVPSGVAVVRNLDPASDVLVKEREKVLAFGAGLDFKTTEALGDYGISIVPADWSAISRLFDEVA